MSRGRVPCDMVTGRPLFASAADGAFWVPLLEKAMAKLQGSYRWALLLSDGSPVPKISWLVGKTNLRSK